MKFCPYCGAVLPGSAVSFCPECGKSVNEPAESNRPQPERPVQAPHPSQIVKKAAKKPSGFRSDKKPPPRSGSQTQMKRQPVDKRKQKPPVRPNPNMKRRPLPECSPAVPNPMDVNYDGYYDDVPTADKGQTKEGLEPELIKRIALIAAGTVAIVILSIIIMYVL